MIKSVLAGIIPRNGERAAFSYCCKKCKLHGQAEEKLPAWEDNPLPLYSKAGSLIHFQASQFRDACYIEDRHSCEQITSLLSSLVPATAIQLDPST